MRYQMTTVGFRCTKALLIALNVLSMITAISIFTFAVVDTHVLLEYGEAEAGGTLGSDILIIAVCVMLVLISVFGIVGVLRESIKLLYLHVGFLMILLVLEVMVAIYVALQRFGVEYKVIDMLREDFCRNNTGENQEHHNNYWEYLQARYECCGLNGPDDYAALNLPITVACCPFAFHAQTAFAQDQLYRSCQVTKSYYAEGCEAAILNAMRESADSMVAVASMGVWFEVTGIILATIVVNNLKNRVEIYKKTIKY